MKRLLEWLRRRRQRRYSIDELNATTQIVVNTCMGDFARVVHRVAFETMGQEGYNDFCERLDFALSVEGARVKADGPISTREIQA